MFFSIFTADRNQITFDKLIDLAESRDLNERTTEMTPELVKAAKQGDVEKYAELKGIRTKLSPFDRNFLETQMREVVKNAQSADAGGGNMPAPKPKSKSKKSKGGGRGFGYMSLSKALKKLAGGPRGTKARLEKAVGAELFNHLMSQIEKAKPVRMGKSGKKLKKRGPITAKSAEQIGGKFFEKMSKAFPFSEKSAKAPKDRDERIMNKARFIRGLGLAYQLLASNVSKEDKAQAKDWLKGKKKKLRMFEWEILQDLEHLGEDTYEAFMALVDQCESELEECIENFDVLSEDTLDDLVGLQDLLESILEQDEIALDEARMSDEARELLLYLRNDSGLHRKKMSAFRTVMKHEKRGRYSADKAAKAMLYVVDAAAKEYHDEFGSPGVKWSEVFDKKARMEVARELVKDYETRYRSGELGEDIIDEAFSMGSADRRVLKAFSMGQALSSKKLSSDGRTLDGNWMGGRGIATRDKEGRVTLHDIGSRAAQSVHRAIRKLVGDGMIESVEDLSVGYLLGEGLTAENLEDVDRAVALRSLLEAEKKGKSNAGGFDYHGLGAQLQHWHSGQGSPIYTVGSMLYAGRKPWRRLVCDAIEELQEMMMSPRYAEHESELRSLISKLRSHCLS